MCLDEAARRQSALSVNKMSNPDLLPNNKTVVSVQVRLDQQREHCDPQV